MGINRFWISALAAISFGCSPAAEDAPKHAAPAEPASASTTNAPQTPAPPKPDVAGLPALITPGKDYPVSDVTIDEYFEVYSATNALDMETRKIRADLLAKVQEELVGKQVTWDGYVQRVENAPSGRVTLVLALNPGPPKLEVAMIRYSAGLSKELHAYQIGDHVRTVAVFDKIVSVFPSLRGISIEPIAEQG